MQARNAARARARAGAGAGAGAGGGTDDEAAAGVDGTDLSEATEAQLVAMEDAILTFAAADDTAGDAAGGGDGDGAPRPLPLTCVSAANDEGWTPLMFCAQVNHRARARAGAVAGSRACLLVELLIFTRRALTLACGLRRTTGVTRLRH